MMQIVKYHSGLKTTWDAFNARALNGTLLFYRDFMEYHAHRFTDHSLLFYEKNKLVALLPLHAEKKEVFSHRGLTFGGFVVSERVTTGRQLQLLEQLRLYLRQQAFETLWYQAPPVIYCRQPMQADLFAFTALGALLGRRTVVSTLDLTGPPAYSQLRKRCLKKALGNGIIIQQSDDLTNYMSLVAATHTRAGLPPPTHTAAELLYLKNLFPAQITLWAAYHGPALVGGVLTFDHGLVVNAQYLATSPAGKELHALDLLLHTLITAYQDQKKYLSLGTSADDGPYGINETLLRNKESYGARPVLQDTYRLDL